MVAKRRQPTGPSYVRGTQFTRARTRFSRIRHSVGFAFLIHLILPGAGHLLWGDYLFGVFVFLVMSLAAILYVVSLLIDFPALVMVLLLIVPLIFYIFSFADLLRARRKRLGHRHITAALSLILLLVGIAFQVWVPFAPGRFAWSNRPSFQQVDSNDFAPVIRRGDVIYVSPFAYRIVIPSLHLFTAGSIWRHIPQRCDIVMIIAEGGSRRLVQIIGLPGESIGISEGELFVDGVPTAPCPARPLRAEWPLTSVPAGSILVGSVKLGSVNKIFAISPDRIVGRARKLF